MKSLILRLLLVLAVLANLSVGLGTEAAAHPATHHAAVTAEAEAAIGDDCCDPAAGHVHDHAGLPGGFAADCHCELGTCAPGVALHADLARPATRLVLLKLRVPEDAPPSSGHIPPLRPPRA